MPAQLWTGAPTCTDVDFVGWEMTVERELSYYILGAPSVIPVDGTPRVVVPAGWYDLLLYDAVNDTEDVQVDVQIDSNGVSAATLQDRSRTVFGMLDSWVDGSVIKLNLSYVDQFGAWDISPDIDAHGAMAPSIVDLDADGVPDFGMDGAVLSMRDGIVAAGETVEWAMLAPAARLSAGEVAILGSAGIWTPSTGALTRWSGLSESPVPVRYTILAPVDLGGEVVILGTDGNEALLAGLDGAARWTVPTGDYRHLSPAIGDVDGDSVPELCFGANYQLALVDVAGDVWWSVAHEELAGSTGGCAMADLDADGRYEVIDYGMFGLFIRDGATGEVLASWEEIGAKWHTVPPVVADVDADGSAEIVVSGGYISEGYNQDHTWILGAAEGRWARTRPVWNQLAYDVTSIRDDGVLNSFPFDNWDTYNSFRAQPSHDGAHPDLVIAGTDACADTCGEGGTVRLAVQVSNPGSVDAPPGAIVRLYTWTAETGLRVVADAVLEDSVPAGESAEGVVFDVPYADWGDRRVLEVVGLHDDECDWVNNREEVDVPDPCAG
ncbi:MAG: hypothetical protein ACOZNI_08200 [Myxococcota bacterium]